MPLGLSPLGLSTLGVDEQKTTANGASGTVAVTNANDTSTASGTTTVLGALAKTNANDTATASGSVGGAVSGTVAATNANDACAAVGSTTIVGTVAKTNANDTATANGIAGSITGTATCTNNDDICNATGSTPLPASTKIGGDDVPEERVEVWSKPKAPKRHDDALDTIMRQAMDKAMGRQPVKPQPAIEHIPANAPVIAGPALVEYDEEDDEETLLLLL